MRTRFFALAICVTVALSGCANTASQSAASTAQATKSSDSQTNAVNPSYLFAIIAATGTTVSGKPRQGEDERFTLTLDAVDSVTEFADRPLRSASVLSPEAFVSSWSTWFADSPPNAVLTFAGKAGNAPQSIVVTLSEPSFEAYGNKIVFTATRTYRTVEPSEKGQDWKRPVTPLSFTDASLFIDNSGDSQAGPLVAALQQSMQEFVFAPNDANTWDAAEAAMSAILTSSWKQGTLTGATAAQAFSVNCEPSADEVLNGYLPCKVTMQLTNGGTYSTIITQTWGSSG